MCFHETKGIRYTTFPSLEKAGLVHAVFTRTGGVSPAPWASLNVGSTVGDDLHRVRQNRKLSFEILNRDPDSLFDVWQVHGQQVVCTDQPRPASVPHEKADAILTDNPRVTLFMRFADCVPILLYDRQNGVVGLVHAGWQGTVLRTASAAVEAMQDRYGSNPANIMAGIGPSIGPDHYEVGPEVIRQVQLSFKEDASLLLSQNGKTRPGHAHLDLWQANQRVLETAGVEQIEVAGLCTACSIEDWFSHRQERGRTGRFGALIALSG